jgi:hypothetical protein
LGVWVFVLLASILLPSKIFAADKGGFSLQVTPSPLIATIEPGKQSSLELRVRNNNTSSEDLKMELKSFSVDRNSGEVKVSSDLPKEVNDFVSFAQPTFTLSAGQWFTQKININTPKNAGFSYSFAIMISRKNPLPKTPGSSRIEGSVAVFTLLNTNRPDATKKLNLESFSSKKRVYEYLPADFDLSVENTGNTIIQPRGNIFISRSGDEQNQLATLQINPGGGYIIPDSTRKLNMNWNDGFPSRDSNGKTVWDWTKLNKLRIGKYTAKAVLIYDDGQRDIPIYSEVSFWVIPWKILIVIGILIIVLGFGVYTIFGRPIKKLKKRYRKKPTEKIDEQ